MQSEGVLKTFIVALCLCVVCSVVVSSTAVSLRQKQEENKALDIRKNLLLAAGLIKSAHAAPQEIAAAYKKVEPVIVDLRSGELRRDIEAETFNRGEALRQPETRYVIPAKKDLARIKVRSQLRKLYLVHENDAISQIILPVRGKGLYSTLYGFLALASDAKTVRGLSFYEQGETPGLGGEVENPRWKAQWPGKKVFDEQGDVAIELVKSGAGQSIPAAHKVDAISGATMTSRGVRNLLHYWLGENGYGPFLEKFRQSEGRV